MSKPKQWKQGRDVKRYDVLSAGIECGGEIKLTHGTFDDDAYPQEAEPDGRLWVGSGDSQ